MADTKISDMTAAVSVADADLVPIVQGGANKAATAALIRAALSATNLTSGTVPDARFPATLPALNGSALTALNATQLTSGTVPDARFPATLPASSGANLTALNASNLASGTVPTARLATGTADGTTFHRGDGVWAVPAGGGGYTDEEAQDAVGAMLVDTATIDLTYVDATPALSADVINDSITYAKIQNVSATDKILGRSTAGAGDVEEIACTAAGRALLDDADASAQRTTLGLGTLATQSGTFSGTSSGTNTGDDPVSLAGALDYITIAGQVITRGAIDLTTDVTGDLPLANLAQAGAASKLLGRGDSGAGDYQEITIGANLTMTGTTLSSSGGAGYTDEQAQDAIGTILVDSATIDFTYDDGVPSITASVIGLPVKATGAEIDTGTDDAKFATAKAIEDSLYIKAAYADAKVADAINDTVTTIAPSQNAVFDALANKQATLVSATNIKTINGSSVLGAGDLVVSGATDFGLVTACVNHMAMQ